MLERRIASMFGGFVGYVIVFLQLLSQFVEISIFRDFLWQVRCQLVPDLVPELLRGLGSQLGVVLFEEGGQSFSAESEAFLGVG